MMVSIGFEKKKKNKKKPERRALAGTPKRSEIEKERWKGITLLSIL